MAYSKSYKGTKRPFVSQGMKNIILVEEELSTGRDLYFVKDTKVSQGEIGKIPTKQLYSNTKAMLDCC